MTKRLLAAFLLAVPVAAAARAPGSLGVGPIVGDPTGATAKYFIKEDHALDFGLGVSHTLTLWADYVWHGWEALPQPGKGPLALYLAAGPRLETQNETDFGIRTMAGLSYWPRFKRTYEFYLELGPVYRLAPDVRVRIDGGFGVRYYFAPVRRSP